MTVREIGPHNMTSGSLPTPFVATATSNYSGYDPFRAFDGAVGSGQYWIGTGNGVDKLQLDLGSGVSYILDSYKFQANTIPEPARMPKNWTLQGSNDNSTWTTVDTRTNETSWGSGEIRTYTCATRTTAYRYFRANITANNGDANYTDMGEWSLLADVTAFQVWSTSVGPNSNGTSSTINIPAGTGTTGDVTYIAFYHQTDGSQFSASTTTMTPPSGWTADVNIAGMLVCHRAWQSGDPTSVTATSNTSGWWESCAVTVINCDTTTPTDAASGCIYVSDASSPATQRIRAPSVNPIHNGGMLLCAFGTMSSSGHTISPLPAGLTSQASTGNGPGVLIATKTLTDGSPTGNFDSVQSGVGAGTGIGGASIVIKASGASVATVVSGVPVITGFFNAVGSNTTPRTLPLGRMGVQNNDLVLVYTSGSATLTAASGYGSVITNHNTALYSHTWLTGDSTSPSFSLAGGAYANFDVFIIRRSDAVGAPTIDTSASASTTGTGVSVAPPVVSPAGTNEIQFAYYGTHQQGSGTWSAVTNTGLTEEDTVTGGPCSRIAWKEGISSATSGSLTATLSGTNDLTALSVLIGVPATAGANQPIVFTVS